MMLLSKKLEVIIVHGLYFMFFVYFLFFVLIIFITSITTKIASLLVC